MGQYRYIVGWLVCNLPSFSLYSGSVALNRYIQAFFKSTSQKHYRSKNFK